MTASTSGWSAVGATVNPLGQSYTDEDYYAVLADGYLLHGYVRAGRLRRPDDGS